MLLLAVSTYLLFVVPCWSFNVICDLFRCSLPYGYIRNLQISHRPISFIPLQTTLVSSLYFCILFYSDLFPRLINQYITENMLFTQYVSVYFVALLFTFSIYPCFITPVSIAIHICSNTSLGLDSSLGLHYFRPLPQALCPLLLLYLKGFQHATHIRQSFYPKVLPHGHRDISYAYTCCIKSCIFFMSPLLVVQFVNYCQASRKLAILLEWLCPSIMLLLLLACLVQRFQQNFFA